MQIVCKLGRVSSPTKGVVVDDSRTVGNSSKWIFDIEAPAGSMRFEIQLLDFHKGAPKRFGVLDPRAVAVNEAAALSPIYFPEPDRLVVVVEPTLGDESEEPRRFRLTVDALHSLMR
jgi:hypothetical protein